MQTIVLTTQKGGSGKSTLAISLTLAAIRAGHNVRLIETDPQGTVSKWRSRRPYAAPIVEAIYDARALEERLRLLPREFLLLRHLLPLSGFLLASGLALFLLLLRADGGVTRGRLAILLIGFTLCFALGLFNVALRFALSLI